MAELSNEQFDAALDQLVTITPRKFATVIHQKMMGRRGEHHGHLSCPCYHRALYYLGVTDEHGLYWPDGEGGNAWDRKEHDG